MAGSWGWWGGLLAVPPPKNRRLPALGEEVALKQGATSHPLVLGGGEPQASSQRGELPRVTQALEYQEQMGGVPLIASVRNVVGRASIENV